MELSRNVDEWSLRSEPAPEPLPRRVRHKLGLSQRGALAVVARVCHGIQVADDYISERNVPITSRLSIRRWRTRSSRAAWKAILCQTLHVLVGHALRPRLIRRIHIDQNKQAAVDDDAAPLSVEGL